MINQKVKWKNIIIIHSIISLAFSWLIFLIAIIITLFVEGFKLNYDKILASLSFKHYMSVIDFNFLIYTSMLGIILTYNYIKYIKQVQKEKAGLSIKLINEKMKFLQSQMHPHFLFNTLNGIHSLMDIDINKSKTMIVDLSDLLRNVLDKKDENLIELQEELTILKKYINLNKTRFSDQLKFHINIEENLENILVPNMLIQPIIENATKHGYNKNHTTMEIYLSIKKKGNLLIITIENNGKLLTENFQTLLKKGSGLNNIKERLEALYKSEHEFCIYNNYNKVITKIGFPIEISVSEISDEF
ncbi:sensor histidine kinase [Thalassobellus citreus]|uniref:sensor histidine kinase n=1 Tax=Thalassobellus citreus TaxID=3367752 RepID=UPI0037A711D3